ncbi:MAG: hypothetical protein L6Q92_04685 [Phycisphaerae bacterium]|nr:hypothetical protein [Phycisphaerae bacterium]
MEFKPHTAHYPSPRQVTLHDFKPYIYGLPEMLDSYGGVDVRRGTDYY